MKIDDGDPGYATLVSDLKRVVGGVRFDFVDTAALKLEGQRASEASGPYVNRIVVGVNLAF